MDMATQTAAYAAPATPIRAPAAIPIANAPHNAPPNAPMKAMTSIAHNVPQGTGRRLSFR